MTRIDRDEYFLRMATLVSMRSTCLRRHAGCVLVDSDHHVLATGYNGVPRGLPHCSEGHACAAAHAAPGEALDGCLATHAEANALLQCPDVRTIRAAYCTDSPCIHCVKLLLNTGCESVYFERRYPHDVAGKLWTDNRGRDSWRSLRQAWPFVLSRGYDREDTA